MVVMYGHETMGYTRDVTAIGRVLLAPPCVCFLAGLFWHLIEVIESSWQQQFIYNLILFCLNRADQ